MSVYKDKKSKTWYFIVRVDGKQYKRRNKDWRLKRHAVEAERQFLNNLDLINIEKKDMTFEQVSDQYLEFIKMNRKASTITNTEYMLRNHINDYFGSRKINDITRLDIERYQTHLLNKEYLSNGKPAKLSNDYVSKIQSLMRRVLTYAVSHRIIPFNPFDLVENAKRQELVKKRDVRILTKKEYVKVIKVIDDVIEKALFSILYWCGLRIGEALALDISDVDFKNNKLSITKNFDTKNQIITTTKTGNVRDVDVPDQCMKDINNLIDYYKTFEDIEFNTSFPLLGYTQRLAKGTLDRHKNEYIEDSGVPYFTFHELRHTHVSTLIQIGMRDIDIAKRLGHSVEMVNNTYGHLFPEDKETLIEKLNNL